MNYLARYAHSEHPDSIIFSMSPGWVQTDMGNLGARTAGREKAPITVDESVYEFLLSFLDYSGQSNQDVELMKWVAGMTKVIDGASRDKEGGLHMR